MNSTVGQIELARLTKMCSKTLQRWRKYGGMPYLKASDNSVIFHEREVMKYVQERHKRYVKLFENAFNKLRNKK